MWLKCFGCNWRVDADDSETLADMFIAHGAESHEWTYPERALRSYAANFGDATQRLGSETERLSAIGEVAVHPVTEDRIDDWLQFFDHDAFAGNPDWASCYCLEPHRPPTDEEPERPWRATRSIMTERLRSGTSFGYLAYVDDRPAGWVNASPRSDYALYSLVDPEGPEPSSVIGVSCFVVAPPFRRHGVASVLLDTVIADASSRGAAFIEGYPLNEPEPNDGGHFRGPRSMYDARGFVQVEARKRDTVVRLPVP